MSVLDIKIKQDFKPDGYILEILSDGPFRVSGTPTPLPPGLFYSKSKRPTLFKRLINDD